MAPNAPKQTSIDGSNDKPDWRGYAGGRGRWFDARYEDQILCNQHGTVQYTRLRCSSQKNPVRDRRETSKEVHSDTRSEDRDEIPDPLLLVLRNTLGNPGDIPDFLLL